ncbi:unnamed protein product [Rotaria magnacalcarata]|uniref:Uncharacterized protein n=1 Tax=Rotaria magnacalcarata TaxID=392030 RepID=A0A816WGG8_9BILA|nr:unnamed protein product [Rotaria magnacalcarata]
MDLLIENQGLSWSIGGDYTYSKFLSLPNILRQYNQKLNVFSTKVSIMFPFSRNNSYNGLNVAKPWDSSSNIVYQAELPLEKLKNEKLRNWNSDWKVITNNDLCSFCKDNQVKKYTPEQYLNNIRNTLDKLYNASLPSTLINLVLPFDIRSINNISHNYIKQYHRLLSDLINSKRYEKRNDFTVVIQLFKTHNKLSYKHNSKIDFSYFAQDCFHLSGKGHSLAVISLLNNLFEPVGGKKRTCHIGKPLKCSTKEYPCIFTSKHSAKALDEVRSRTMMRTTDRVTKIIRNTSTSDHNRISHYHRKHKKADSDLSHTKLKFIVIISFLFIIISILTVDIMRRRKPPTLIPMNKPDSLAGTANS